MSRSNQYGARRAASPVCRRRSPNMLLTTTFIVDRLPRWPGAECAEKFANRSSVRSERIGKMVGYGQMQDCAER